MWPPLVFLRYLSRNSAFSQTFPRVSGRILRQSSVILLFCSSSDDKYSVNTFSLMRPHKKVTGGQVRRSGWPVYWALSPIPVIVAFFVQVKTHWTCSVWPGFILLENIFSYEMPQSRKTVLDNMNFYESPVTVPPSTK